MLLSYVRRHYKIVLLLLLFAAVFALVFSLYDLPVEAVLYATVLCAAVGLAMFFIGYALYVRRHRRLRELLGRAAVSIDELPEPRDYVERDYQELVRVLFREKTRIASEADIDKQDMIDYYTLWVHQIKTPIAAMHLLLQSDSEQPDRNRLLSAELFKIEQYADMVLHYLRIGSDTKDLVLRTCALDDVVRRSLRKFARLFIMKKLQLNFQESGLEVLTDEKWLSFIIDQLLSNALKYTPSGTVSVYADGYALVIEDTGIGIRPEDLPRIFDKGYTGFNGREDKKSTGIGLYLVRRAAALLGHSISASSEPGRGTRFKIGFNHGDLPLE